MAFHICKSTRSCARKAKSNDAPGRLTGCWSRRPQGSAVVARFSRPLLSTYPLEGLSANEIQMAYSSGRSWSPRFELLDIAQDTEHAVLDRD